MGFQPVLRSIRAIGFAGYRVPVPIRIDPDVMRRLLIHEAKIHARALLLEKTLLEHGCLVVVEVGSSYFPGTLETKHPTRARMLTVMTEAGMRLRRTPRGEVFRVTWEHLRRPF